MRSAIVKSSKLDGNLLNASRYVGTDYKGRYVRTITKADIYPSTTRVTKRYQELAPLGQVLACDIGKQIWEVNGVYQVESTEQRDRRITAGHDGGRELSLSEQRRQLELKHNQEIDQLMRQ